MKFPYKNIFKEYQKKTRHSAYYKWYGTDFQRKKKRWYLISFSSSPNPLLYGTKSHNEA